MVNPQKQTAALLAPRPATTAELGQDLAVPAPSLTGNTEHTGRVRRALEDVFTSELTPELALRALRCARDLSDVPFFVKTAMEALRRSPNLQSLMQTRVLALTALPLIAEPSGTKLADKKAAEAAQEVLSSEPVESILTHLLLTGTYLGFGVAQCFYDTSTQPWTLTSVEEVPPHYLTFDKNDARTPYLLPLEMGGPLQPLSENKFIYHRPGLISGNPVTSGVAYAALFYEALKGLAQRGWVGFVELYGQPIRVGHYPQGLGATAAGKKDLDVLKRALRDLGGDAWAMLPETMKIEIVEAASRNGSAEVYERLCRFQDEQLAKLILGGSLTGGTGSSGSGSGKGLGQIHNELRHDVMKGDAKSLGNTIRRCVIKPITGWNFGPNAAVPKVYFQFEVVKDIAVRVKAVCDLSDRGFKVPAAEMYSLLDIRPPTPGEDVLGALAATAPTTASGPSAPSNAMTAKFSAAPAAAVTLVLDELDTLGAELLSSDEYALANAAVDDALLKAIEGHGSADSLKAALISAVKSGDIAGLQAIFAAGTTAARLAGDLGAQLGRA